MQRAIKIILYIVVFVLPLLFVPGVQDFIEFPKQTLLVVLVALAALLWLIEVVSKGTLSYYKNPIHWILIGLAGAVLVSALLGQDRYGSLVGWGAQISSSFATILFLTFFVFLALNTWKTGSEAKKGLTLYLISVWLATLFGVLQLTQTYILPFDFSKTNAFNTVGTANSLGILAGSAMMLSLGWLFAASKARAAVKGALVVATLTFFLYLIFLGFKPVWWMLGPAVLTVLLLGYLSKQQVKLRVLLWLVGFIVVSILFSLFTFTVWNKAVAPVEISLNQGTSWDIASATLQEKPVFGFGPGSFTYQFLREKPDALNATAFWAVRFGKGASEFLTQLTSVGLVGVVLLVAFLLYVVIGVLKTTLAGQNIAVGNTDVVESKKEDFDHRIFVSSVLGSLLFLTIGFFLYPYSIVLWLALFATVAWLLIFCRREEPEAQQALKREVQLEQSPKVSIIVAFVFLIGIIFSVFAGYAMVRRYLAEVAYNRALAAVDSVKAESLFKEAAEFNPYFDFYQRDLASFLFNRFSQVAAQPATPEGQSQMRSYLDQSLAAARKATEINPANSLSWSLRGVMYRSLIGAAENADRFAIEYLQKASEFDPKNPFLHNELGRVYQIQLNLVATNAQVPLEQKRQVAERALSQYEEAVRLKNDYAPALFQSAVIHDLLGQTSQAIQRAEASRALAPADIGVAFQLGTLYYKTKQFNAALAEFERALTVDPNFSNARYFAGLIYDFQGNKQKALEYFGKIEELNKDNQVVKTIIANLKANRPALGRGSIAGETFIPIEESPTRIPSQRP